VSGRLAGRSVVLTGASSGLGQHFVDVLLAEGARVMATARRRDRLERLLATRETERLEIVAGDITEDDFPRQLMAAAAERFGGIDIVINNAGVAGATPAEKETNEEFARVFSVNLLAAFACSREAFPHLSGGGGGAIVNVGSALGLVGIGRIPQASYCASKGALHSLTRELAAQWADDGVRVNCIAPGWFPSEMTEEMMDDERSLDFIRRTVPMGRPGRLEELDEVLIMLCAAGNSYLTGQTIVVDGGWTSI
jgi:NAD(P)-dependent dehydrogenase (short-subunit alcohol dehydrogenase family)